MQKDLSFDTAYCTLIARKAARDIDSYALFGHTDIRTHPTFAYLIICRDSHCRSHGWKWTGQQLHLYIPVIRLSYLSIDIARIILSFYDRNYEVRQFAFLNRLSTEFRCTYDTRHTYHFSLAAHTHTLCNSDCDILRIIVWWRQTANLHRIIVYKSI